MVRGKEKNKPLRIAGKSSAKTPAGFAIPLRPRRIAYSLSLFASVIILLGLILQVMFYTTDLDNYLLYLDFLFNVDDELNIPSYFSSVILLVSSLLLISISNLKFRVRDKYRRHWAFLGFGFLLLAADEMLTLHEHLNKPFKQFMGGDSHGLFTFAWVLPGMIIVVLIGVLFLRFLIHLPARTKLLFVISGFFYVGGLLGIEMLGARYADDHGMHNLTYAIFTIAEESAEMFGIIIFIYALLSYIRDNYRELTIRFQ